MKGIKMDTEKLLAKIKNYLIDEYDNEYESWREFVDNQHNGDCQSIVSSICNKFPKVKKVFGEIQIDYPYIDEYGDEQEFVTHHWIMIKGEIYDFSKGTLNEYINWVDLYDVDASMESHRYVPICG